jgi:hypothetical protein
MIRIEKNASEIRAGQTLKGQVVWSADKGKSPRKIEVTIQWVMSGKGVKSENVVDSVVDDATESKSQVVVPFEVEVPSDGPLSYDGKLFRVFWEIKVEVDLPFAVDEEERDRFTVLPAFWTAEDLRSRGNLGLDDLDEDFEDDEEDHGEDIVEDEGKR